MSLSRMLCAFVISLLLPWASASWAQDFTLKAQFFLPKPHPVSKQLDQIYKEIEAASGGKVKIQAFWAGELVPTPQALDGLSRGTLDILAGPGNYYSGKIAIADISIMPLNFKRASDRSKVFYDRGVGAILDGIYRKSVGVAIVAPFTYFIGEEWLLRKGVTVKGVADFKGQKVRVAGGELVELARALGGEPVFIPPPEAYTALQRRTIDGLIFPIHDLDLLKLKEVVGSSVGPDYLFSGPMMHYFMFNLKSWEKLGPDLQGKIAGALRKAAAHDDANAIKDLETPFRASAEKAGVKFITLSQPEIQKAMKAVEVARNYYITKNKEQGHGAEAEQILKILHEVAGQ